MTARAGEGVVLRCDVIHPVTGQPPPYVVEWFKFGVPIPIFIKFGYYPPHVDPEYAGKVLAGPSCLGPRPSLSPAPPPSQSRSLLISIASYLSLPLSLFPRSLPSWGLSRF